MIKKLIAIGVAGILIVLVVWMFLGWGMTSPPYAQEVDVEKDLNMYPWGNCFLGVMLRTEIDGDQYSVYGDIEITSPDGDVASATKSSTLNVQDTFCAGDWHIEVMPIEYEVPSGGYQAVQGELFKYDLTVAPGNAMILTMTFSWME